MCGIGGLHRMGDTPIPNLGTLADELLVQLEGRGRDAAGILGMYDNGLVHLQKRIGNPINLVNNRDSFPADARTLMVHTRWTTVGDAKDIRNAHPVVSGRCAAVHNGTIWNADEIFKGFNLPRIATVDSEVIPALVHEMGWQHAADAFDLMDGGAAVAVVNADHPNELILARTKDFPLVYLVEGEVLIWASTRQVILEAWQKAYGKQPTADFQTLGEWSMVRVNGTLGAVETIREVVVRESYWTSWKPTFSPIYMPRECTCAEFPGELCPEHAGSWREEAHGNLVVPDTDSWLPEGFRLVDGMIEEDEEYEWDEWDAPPVTSEEKRLARMFGETWWMH